MSDFDESDDNDSDLLLEQIQTHDFDESDDNGLLLSQTEQIQTPSGTWKCEETNRQLINDIRKWTCVYNISQSALKAITKIINVNLRDSQLPADPRTIMKTPRTTKFTQIGGDKNPGFYWHQGFEFCLRNCFRNLADDLSISINVNIDGLQIFNSSNKCFWPILFNIHELPSIKPMALGVFYGDSKPANIVEYLEPFVNEIDEILKRGILVNGHRISVVIRCFICDSPARAFLKGKKSHI